MNKQLSYEWILIDLTNAILNVIDPGGDAGVGEESILIHFIILGSGRVKSN